VVTEDVERHPDIVYISKSHRLACARVNVVVFSINPFISVAVGISGCCASMRNAPDLRIQGTFLYLLFFGPFYFYPFHFVVYSIYMRTCTIATHPFASATPRDNRKYYFLPFLDHATSISTVAHYDSVLA